MIVETRNIRKEYDDLIAVNNVNLVVPEGEIYALIGPNGAGKTTLMRMIAGLLEPTAGTAYIRGLDVWNNNIDANAFMAFLPDFFSCYPHLKVWEYLDYFAQAYKMPKNDIPKRIQDVLEKVGLQDKRDAKIKGLSRGMMQRLGIAKSIIHYPKLLICDEPASGLDPNARDQLATLFTDLKDEGITILISSHILTELASFCTYVGIMEHGFLVKSGSIKDMVRKEKLGQVIVIEAQSKRRELLAYLKTVPGVSQAVQRGSSIVLSFQGSTSAIAELNRSLIMNKFPITSFSRKTADIQDIFQEVTQREGAELKEKTRREGDLL